MDGGVASAFDAEAPWGRSAPRATRRTTQVQTSAAPCGAALPVSPTPRPNHSGVGAPQPLPQGERRQLTVVFSDLVGSTAISQQLDPEEWRDVLTEYQRLTADAVARFGGHVAQHQGDGIVVYFGWPEARGDDAERAVRAGLVLREGFAALQRRLIERHGVWLA